ncbi:nitroreductase/quinone reductase family protein [Jongsikchunia kroppenstedtii]|uniref:nitroreductase/quinone reductase family protein n=1 Tax=Jongsikchunia kroppenstedtii TaxID=1121721 RepID=UPI00037735C5|nr:nitroreductase/quinone reductase family protein [Jongsikchunia kroppenstedtii]
MNAGSASTYYKAPTGRFERGMNASITWLARHGISLYGSSELIVTGRKSGTPQRIAVNPLNIEGERFLIAPRGTTQWVRNLRAAGGAAELRVGRRTEAFTAQELAADDPATIEVLREYVRRWGWEVKAMLPEPIDAESDDATMARVAAQLPMFRIVAG